MKRAAVKAPARAASRTFYVLVAATVAAIGFGVYRSQQSAASPQPQAGQASAAEQPSPLTSMRPFVDFGSVSMGAGNVSTRYLIRNSGGAPVTIKRIYTSCMCTNATLVTPSERKGPFGMPGHGGPTTLKALLPAGELATVEVVFDPAAHGPSGLGRVERTVTLETDAGQPLQLNFVAMVTP